MGRHAATSKVCQPRTADRAWWTNPLTASGPGLQHRPEDDLAPPPLSQIAALPRFTTTCSTCSPAPGHNYPIAAFASSENSRRLKSSTSCSNALPTSGRDYRITADSVRRRARMQNFRAKEDYRPRRVDGEVQTLDGRLNSAWKSTKSTASTWGGPLG